MFKKNKLLLTVLTLIICITMIFTLVACKNDEKETDETEETIEQLFTNGQFTEVSSDSESYPKAPSKWTATPGSTSSQTDLKTPQSSDDVSKGVVDVSKYTIGNGNPGKADNSFDNKMLMINNITATSYAYVSDSISLDKKSYYKLTFYVKTSDLSSYGAYAYVLSDAYGAFENIDTDGKWEQKTIYLRTPESESASIKLSLGLGTGNAKYGYLTKGYAYFDQVVLENLTEVEDDATPFSEADFNALEETDSLIKIDCRTINTTFDYTSNQNAALYTPAQLTGKGGTGAGTAASTGSTYVEKGILDIAQNPTYKFAGYSADAIATDKATGSIGNRMLCINNIKSTAYGYKDNNGLYIEKDKYYKITSKIKTLVGEGSGAVVRLVNSSSEELVALNNLNTSGAWQTIEFYVKANAYTSNTLNIEYWNGFGGQGDGKWTAGAAFFDDLTYEIIDQATYDSAVSSTYVGKYSYATPEGTLIDMTSSLLKSTQYEKSFLDGENLKYTTTSIVNTEEAGAFKGADATYFNTLKIDNTKPTAFSMSSIYKLTMDGKNVDETNKEVFKILPNTAYELTFWAKTTNLTEGASAKIAIISYDPDKQDDYDNAVSEIQAISSINSDSLTDYVDENHSGYTRFSVYILGGAKDTTYAGISITLGTGTNSLQSDSFVMGQLYVSNIRMQQISYSDYSSVSTSTVVFKTSLGGSGNSGELSSNGNFTYIDLSNTNTLYKDSLSDIWNADQQLIGTAVPKDWSITNSAALAVNGGSSKAGVIDVNYYNLASIEAGLTKDNIFSTMSSTYDKEKYPNVLYIDAQNATSIGYKSSSITLDAKSYYMISVYAKAVSGTFSIDVSRTNISDPSTSAAQYTTAQVGNGWNLYVFYIQTGVTSSSVSVGLYAGFPGNTAPDANRNAVLFTQATYTVISENVYNNAVDSIKEADMSNTSTIQYRSKYANYIYATDTMDNTSSSTTDELVSPSNWTGAAVDSSASTTDDDLAKGVFNQTQSNWSELNIKPDTDEFVENVLYSDINRTGDSVLVIFNKKDTSYGYTSNSFTLKSNKYYKVSIDVLTKDLKYVDPETVDTSVEAYEKWVDKKLYETATITLTINNKTYTFGKSLAKKAPTFEDTEEGNIEKNNYYADVDRIVNNSNGWKTYTYYIAVADEITETMTATLKISLGGKNVSYWQSGYVFIDNFTVEDIEDEAAFNAVAPSDESLTYGNAAYDKDVASITYKINFTSEDATAEAEVEEEEEETTSNSTAKDWLWLYITSGVIGGVIVIVLVIYLIKKYAPKGGKKFKKAKTKTITKDSTRGKFSN